VKQWCKQCRGFRCICQLTTTTSSALQWIILQHPTEAKHAKNTGRLLALSLGVTPYIGEEFNDNATLQQMIRDDIPQALLFVEHPLISNPTLDLSDDTAATLQRIWVVDATWRKALKMILANPFLQRLPIITVNSTTQWSVRSAPSEQHLATIEAAAALCQQFGEPAVAQTLSQNFLRWQDEISRFRPD
jgi:DTW domain-containing protein YfiP